MRKKTSPAQRRATKKWNDEHTKTYSFKYNLDKEKQFVDYIETIEKKAVYFKNLVYEDMKNKGLL